ncbi:uncharacterized protein [Watersipora subatra]|uniref:uncharacterized protein n=1 Tax=Watersipora subatra TaxID=2589382 RepID=UPI00355BA01E
MKWHPMIIRWALTLRAHFSFTYTYMRSSGFISLPAEPTLKTYTSYRSFKYGIDNDNISLLSEQLGSKRSITLLHDEVKIKEGFFYQKSSGELTGFIEIGSVNSALGNLETGIDSSPKLATHVLCFMARGILSKTCLQVAHFTTNCFWDLISHLELNDIYVRSSVSDGASTNRKFIKLHASDYRKDEITHRAINIFAQHPRTIYFVSDVPHLLKTTRNCIENSHGNCNSRKPSAS